MKTKRIIPESVVRFFEKIKERVPPKQLGKFLAIESIGYIPVAGPIIKDAIKEFGDNEQKQIIDYLKYLEKEHLSELSAKVGVTREHVESIKDALLSYEEELERQKEAEARSIAIIRPGDTEALKRALSPHKPTIGFVEPEEMREIRSDKKVVIIGKAGAGKTRLLLEYLNNVDKHKVVLMRGFIESSIDALYKRIQDLDDFVLVWDDLQAVDNKLINDTMLPIDSFCKAKNINFCFIGSCRERGKIYEFDTKKVYLDPDKFKGTDVVNKCREEFNKEIKEDVAERLIEKSNKTPFYLITFFCTFSGKKIKMHDIDTLPPDTIDLWKDYMHRNRDRLNGDNSNALRSMALVVQVEPRAKSELVESIYTAVFRGTRARYYQAMNTLEKLFLIEQPEKEKYSMHDVIAEAVEEEYKNESPSEETRYKELLGSAVSLPKEYENFLWGYADKIYNKGDYYSLEKEVFSECLEVTNRKGLTTERKWRLYFWLGRLCRKLYPREATGYYDRAVNEAPSNQHKAEALLYRSYVLFDEGDFFGSIRDISDAESLEGIYSGRILGHRGRSWGQVDASDAIDTALKELSKAINLSLRQSKKDWRESRHACTTIRQRGDLYLKLGEDRKKYIRKAYRDIKKSLQIAEKEHIGDRIGNAKRALGDYYQVIGKPKKAENCYREALNIAKEYAYLKVETLVSMSRLAEHQGDKEHWREYAKEALALAEEYNYKALLTQAHLILARLELQEANQKEAQAHACKARSLIRLTKSYWDNRELEELQIKLGTKQ